MSSTFQSEIEKLKKDRERAYKERTESLERLEMKIKDIDTKCKTIANEQTEMWESLKNLNERVERLEATMVTLNNRIFLEDY